MRSVFGMDMKGKARSKAEGLLCFGLIIIFGVCLRVEKLDEWWMSRQGNAVVGWLRHTDLNRGGR